MKVAEISRFWLGMARVFWGTILYGFYSLRVSGIENVPRVGPVILAPNHSSYLDPPTVAVPLRRYLARTLYYMAWHRLFEVPIFGNLIWKMGARPVNLAVPVDRAAYRMVGELLRLGHAVCIFPEGQRNKGWHLLPLKQGVAGLSLETGAPVVPVWIDGTGTAWPRHKTLPRPFVRVSIEFLPAIDPKSLDSLAPAKDRRNEIMSRLQAALEGAAAKSRFRPADGQIRLHIPPSAP